MHVRFLLCILLIHKLVKSSGDIGGINDIEDRLIIADILNNLPSNKDQPKFKFHKDWLCKRCHKEFKRRQHLRRHVRTFHRKELRFICLLCDKAATRKDNLQRHIRTTHRTMDIDFTNLNKYIMDTKKKKL